MEDGATAVTNRPRPRLPAGMLAHVQRRSLEPRHRRRRALALSLVAVVALIAGVFAGAGGGRALHHDAAHGGGYFARIRTLAGEGPGSFAAAERTEGNAA